MTTEPDNGENLLRSVATSLLVCVPSFILAMMAMESNAYWSYPGYVMMAILGLAAANFTMIVALEYYQSKIGAFTIPALLFGVGLVFLFIIMESVNRFVVNIGYDWLYPLVALYVLFSGLAIFKEKMLVLKFHIGINSVALAVLWSLGEADRIALPF